MASAAETQLGISQMQLKVFDQIAQSSRFVIEQEAENRRQAANIWQGMVTTAQNAKQLEINTYLKERELDLRAKQIDVDARLANINVGLKQAGLDLESKRVQIAQDTLDFNRQKSLAGDRNKAYASAASKMGASILSKGRLDYSATDSRYKILLDQKGKLTAAERLVVGPKIDSELSSLSERRAKIEQEIQRGELYQQESLMVLQGAEPGSVIAIPGFENYKPSTTSTSQPSRTSGINPELPTFEVSDDLQINPLFPSIDTNALNEANNARNEIGLDPINTELGEEYPLPGDDNSEYPEPQEITPSGQTIPLSSNNTSNPQSSESTASTAPERPTFTRDQILGTLNSIEDDKVAQEAPQVIALADEDTKAYLTTVRSDIEKDFLLSYGSMTNFNNVNRPDDAIDYIKNTMVDYARNGGNQYGIAALQRESKSAISRIRAEALVDKSLFENGNTSGKYIAGVYIDGEFGPTYENLVAAKYNEWVLTRGQKVQESDQAKKENEVRTGVLADGKLDLSLAREFSQDVPVSISNLESVFSETSFERSSSIAQGDINRKNIIDEIEGFRKEFLFQEGPNKGKVKQSFVKIIADNAEALYKKEMGISGMMLTNDFKKQVKDESRTFGMQKAREALENRMVALQLWKDIKSLNK